MSSKGAPQKQIPFDELEIVHVQSQDTEARPRKAGPWEKRAARVAIESRSDLLPRGYVGGCVLTHRPALSQCFAICRCFILFRPAVDISQKKNSKPNILD
nr:uncharacterized protein LOC108127512 [Drosophila bipectinata]